ncbi:hypothetical protein, partial [Salmonella sp. SAL4433]|uniref:hypothetical protein n=1 Tax=Salmonella sp. SAL4433 TaxID=3159888 RepID=UPI00397BA7E8
NMASGRGSDVMQPMAIPSVGGMAVHIITFLVAPCIYCLVMEWQFKWRSRSPVDDSSGSALSRI